MLRQWSTDQRNQPRCESLLLGWELEYYLLLDRRNDPQKCSCRGVGRIDKTKVTECGIQVGNGRNLFLQDPWRYNCAYSNELEEEQGTYHEGSV